MVGPHVKEVNVGLFQRMKTGTRVSRLEHLRLKQPDSCLRGGEIQIFRLFLFGVSNLLLAFTFPLWQHNDYSMSSQTTKNPESIYDITVKDAKGNDVDLSPYKGKVLLIVNVASKCGMTNSNYTELNQLYEKYKDQGLEILAFPCNQFGEEEPGSNDQISEFVCTRFRSEFPIFGKIEVNGDNASPLYKYLKLGKWGIFGDDIQWNFAKFLVGKDGQVVHRYYPTTPPLSLEYDIKKLLGLGQNDQ